MDASRVTEFADAFDREVRVALDQVSPPRLEIEAAVALSQIDGLLVRDLARMEPFGPGNAEPLFLASGVSLEGCRVVGASNARGHLKFIACQNGSRINAIGFDWGSYLETAQKGRSHDITFTPQLNEWNGQKSIQLKIKFIEPTH